MSKHSKYIVIILLLIGFGLMSIFHGVDPIYILAFSMWWVCFSYAVSALNQRILFALFLITFFVFLMGGHFVYEYFGMKLSYYLGYEYYRHSNISLFISLLSIFISYTIVSILLNRQGNGNICNPTCINKEDKKKNAILGNIIDIRNVSKILFYSTSLFWIYLIVEKAYFVQTRSYLDYYIGFESSAPIFIHAIGAMCPYFFYIYLATFPQKSECRIPILLYIIYGCVSLLTGRRIFFVSMLLFISAYYILRNYMDNNNKKWITKNKIILISIIVPIGLVFLYSYNYIRAGKVIAGSPLKEMFLGFFQQQGFSSSLIRLGKYYHDSLNDDAYYSFFGIVKWARTNTLIKLIFNPQYDFSYSYNNVALAMKGNSLSYTLSYIVLGDRYLRGSALGSCYIAELYHDFGNIGIILGNFIYGALISMIDRMWTRRGQNVWILAFCFGIFDSFMRAPRFHFDIIFASSLDLGMWSAFILVFGIVFLLSIKDKKDSKNENNMLSNE